MPIKQITPNFYVAPQIDASDLAEAQAVGVTAVICNRPDGEEYGQPMAAEIEAAAAAHGMTFAHIPITSGGMTYDAIEATKAALTAAGGPVLAYCRSGTRSSFLWAAAMAATGAMSPDAIIQAGAAQGYNLEPLRGFLGAAAAKA